MLGRFSAPLTSTRNHRSYKGRNKRDEHRLGQVGVEPEVVDGVGTGHPSPDELEHAHRPSVPRLGFDRPAARALGLPVAERVHRGRGVRAAARTEPSPRATHAVQRNHFGGDVGVVHRHSCIPTVEPDGDVVPSPLGAVSAASAGTREPREAASRSTNDCSAHTVAIPRRASEGCALR